MSEPTKESALLPADILLARGTSELSRGIIDADGGSYSHAALWSGAEVIESTLPAVRTVTLSTCLGSAEYVDVFRYRNGPIDASAVVADAMRYVGRPYAALDLALSAVVIGVSSWMPNDWSEMVSLYGAASLERMIRMVRRAKDDATSGEAETGRVTCAGLVVCAYHAADAPISVQLQAGRQLTGTTFVRALLSLYRRAQQPGQGPVARGAPFGPSKLPADGWTNDLRWLETVAVSGAQDGGTPLDERGDPEALQRSWQAWSGLGGSGTGKAGDEAERLAELRPEVLERKEFEAGADWPPGLVTLRQLERSPDLECVGRVTA